MTTLDAGYLVPIYWDEVLPSDTWNVSQTIFARINTLIKPLMDNLYLDVHWFFTPNRILWNHFPNLMGEQEDPTAPVTYTLPQVEIKTSNPGGTIVGFHELGDYLGLPTSVNNLSVSCLPFRAYLKTYDDYYRDENFVKEQLPVSARGDATVTYNPTNFPLLRRFKRKDFFTSALPWAQKGTAPTLALGGIAPVTGSITATAGQVKVQNLRKQSDNGDLGTLFGGATTNLRSTGGGTWSAESYLQNNSTLTLSHSLQSDLASSVGFTVNAFREFAIIQQYLELDARSGTRYVEHLSAFFGVQPEDSRLQRSEYLGGQTFDLMVTPIAQTSSTGGTGTPQANLSGMGTFAAQGHQFVKSFKEDGIIMAIASIRAEQRYQNGIPKKWSRRSRFDFYVPIFANLGEQPIKNKELYAQGTTADDNIFGYQEAWAEYRYSQSLITGKLRSNDPQSLDVWHLAADPSSLPILGRSFLEENPPMARVLAVPSEPAFTLNGRFNINCARPMPTRSIPGLMRL